MKISKGMVSAGVITAVAAGSVVGVSAVNAHSGVDSERRTELINRIAEDTGADPAAIEASFEAMRAERKAEMEAKKAEHLDGLVASGVLTQEQRDDLEEFMAERKEEVSALKEAGASREEIRETRQNLKAELRAWAEEEGINLSDIKPDRGEGFKRRGFGRGFGGSPSPAEES